MKKPILYLEDAIPPAACCVLGNDWGMSGRHEGINYEIEGPPLALIGPDKKACKFPSDVVRNCFIPRIEVASTAVLAPKYFDRVLAAKSVEDMPNCSLKKASIRVQKQVRSLMDSVASMGCDTIVSFYSLGQGMPALIVSEGPGAKSAAYCMLSVAGWRRK